MTPKTTGRVARAAALLAAAALTVTALASAAGAQTTTTAPADPPTATGSAESTAYDMAMLPASGYDCDRGESTILVADDMRAQSDVYAAVMLAEAVNGCLVYAGHRDMPMSDTQAGIARFAGGIDYVVGSEAAVSTAKLIQAGGTVATVRIGGTDRFHTARLVASRVQAIGYAEGVEDGAASAADDDMDGTDDDMDDADSDADDSDVNIGNTNGTRTYEAGKGTTSVTATLGAGNWTITASASSRVTAPFAPTIVDGGACVMGNTDAPAMDANRKNRLTWKTVEVKGDDCDAEDRTLTIELATNDLDEWDSGTGTFDGVPDHAWTAKFEKQPIPTATLSRLNAPRTTTDASYSTAAMKVAKDGDMMLMESTQAIRLPRTGYWLIEAMPAAAAGGSLNPGGDSGFSGWADAHMVQFGHFNEVYPGNPRYETDSYTCVALGSAPEEGKEYRYQRGAMKGEPVSAADAVIAGSVENKRLLHVGAGCSGYVAITIKAPGGDSGAGDDIMAWNLKVTQLDMAAAS